jgi:hypothetical protein
MFNHVNGGTDSEKNKYDHVMFGYKSKDDIYKTEKTSQCGTTQGEGLSSKKQKQNFEDIVQ